MGIIDTTTSTATLPSSAALRLQHLARRIHGLGPAPLYHLLLECVAMSSAVLDRAEVYAALSYGDGPDLIRAYGGDRLPLTLWLVE